MVRWERAKTRQGTHSVLGRGEVNATGRKPWSQKGTGRARAGDLKAPHHRGGGVAHPKKPRDYSFKLNRKVRRLALMIALSARVAEGRFVLVDRVDNAEGKTTPFRKKLIKLLGVEDEPNAMIIEDTESETMERTSFATNNLPKVQVAAVNKISVYELLRHRHVIMTTDALNTMQEKLSTPIRRM
ncbi:hypothetical protein CYMTET_19017 [Cymbomonas tetramitiformis]|uniref:Large ribosomal subunit protein uL4m n=1 Tax=Cymbomonas tetramitiformis TaxID=36881 RepID=A0AAE0L5L6_9CHLO|nr:hypothetical protein CYMTET_19017 [Cymbomonas tetramitiformis]